MPYSQASASSPSLSPPGTGFGLFDGEAFNTWGVKFLAADWAGFRFFDAPILLLVATVGFCSIIGLIAGLYPAYKAAKLDPIVALRSD